MDSIYREKSCLPVYLLIIICVLFYSACGSPQKLNDTDLEQILIEVEQINSQDSYFQMTLFGFQDTKSPLYRSTLNHLQDSRPGDIIEIAEVPSVRNTDENSPEIQVLIEQPISLNRVLWSFGKKHYREHHVDYERESTGNRYVIIERMPELIGGLDELQRKVRYLSVLRESDIEGDVLLKFIVNEFGEVNDPLIITSLHEAADKEALRVIREASFRPGEQDGVPVRIQISLPVSFHNK